MKRLLTTAGLSLLGLLVTAAPALAHPLGNFTTNVHLGIHVESERAGVLLVVDMAEIPAFRERPAIDINADGALSRVELAGYADQRCAEHASEVRLMQDRSEIGLVPVESHATETAGQGGLTTLRLECRFDAQLDPALPLTVDNRVYEDRLGWAEIVASGDMAGPDIPKVSPSDELRTYPAGARLEIREVTLQAGGTPETGIRGGLATGGDTSGLATRIERAFAQAGSPSGALLAIVAAIALGAGHALAPGHGKTLMAAYLVGRGGSARQAVGLGLAVAVSHTLGVGILGVFTTAASSFRPESVYPWLSTVSAIVVTGLGLAMLFRSARARIHGRGHHGHEHGHEHEHAHGHGHGDHHHAAHAPIEGRVSLGWKSLAAIGLAGGLVPSASALVLLLGAVAVGRPIFGLALVAAFGVGMSVALVGAGLVALRLTEVGIRRLRGKAPLGRRWVPVIAGMAVTSVGLVLLSGALGGTI